jgi:signal transduction histidine kinase
MFRSIVSKFWVSIVLLLILVITALGLVMTGQFENLFFHQQWNEMNSHGRELAKILAKNHDPELIQREIDFWGQISRFKIAVVNTGGTVTYSSDLEYAPPGSAMEPPELDQALKGEEVSVKRYHQRYQQEMLLALLPVRQGDKVTGVVMLHYPLEHVEQFFTRIHRTIFLVIIAVLTLSTALGLVLARALAVPLIKMNRAAGQMAEGNFDIKVDVRSRDEIGLLGSTLNMLSTRLGATLRDLEDKNDELRRVLTLQKDFVANVSHELRSPLFLIQGYTEAMADGLANEKEIKEKSLRIMLDETHRLRRLVEDLLTLSKTEKEIADNLKEVQLEPVLDKVCQKFKQSASQQRVTIVLEGRRPLPRIKGNEDRLEQVLTNLVDNALRYSPPGGKIKIFTGTTSEGLQVSVSDQGPGIPENELPNIWERFYKVDKARSRKGSGTGLGLAIANNIVKSHGGRIWAESKVGKGTIFKFVIPVVKD